MFSHFTSEPMPSSTSGQFTNCWSNPTTIQKENSTRTFWLDRERARMAAAQHSLTIGAKRSSRITYGSLTKFRTCCWRHLAGTTSLSMRRQEPVVVVVITTVFRLLVGFAATALTQIGPMIPTPEDSAVDRVGTSFWMPLYSSIVLDKKLEQQCMYAFWNKFVQPLFLVWYLRWRIHKKLRS